MFATPTPQDSANRKIVLGDGVLSGLPAMRPPWIENQSYWFSRYQLDWFAEAYRRDMASASVGHAFRSGSGRLCLDFIRTLRHRGTSTQVEELPDAAAVAAWLDRFGPWSALPGPRPVLDGRAAQARELREAIHQLIVVGRGSGGSAQPPAIPGRPPSAREIVNAVAAWPVPAPRLDDTLGLSWHADDPVAATLALIARDALDLVASPALARVHECAGPDCRALFLDSSRPGQRRWCSMNTCGNKAKKENLRTARPR
ncbi:ABATE domain-containing protein [Frankia sp. R82]|uniref:CGNR zinc finger domain-containing protein n=1 Tax=Frankia sp. R82 TaxID=2950553 RepID=UPI0020442BB6|nr:CGNR zinc finger domain-containing protein [Frankia sp. R82]MCM3886064.1 ABATE domain-containing protein [Frankia sp. R82]